MTMERLAQIVNRVVSSPRAPEVRESSRFVEDLGFSSVNAIMLIALIEQEFEIDLEQHMTQLMQIQTVGGAADYISSVAADAK
ncbi:acyl carrier protein [Steroidobacter sp. S1-65]|uniref:Acyl carrier protein n=1 Tax=Steroidobacter gossypii TaxID=2805490 RepID=A0ABS1X018_9GAMM|nr:acyl carrier protein [Steroidobacter gossypii]MBM0106547.1 acyl carrier protein [Steroidobacter gossypii]